MLPIYALGALLCSVAAMPSASRLVERDDAPVTPEAINQLCKNDASTRVLYADSGLFSTIDITDANPGPAAFIRPMGGLWANKDRATGQEVLSADGTTFMPEFKDAQKLQCYPAQRLAGVQTTRNYLRAKTGDRLLPVSQYSIVSHCCCQQGSRTSGDYSDAKAGDFCHQAPPS